MLNKDLHHWFEAKLNGFSRISYLVPCLSKYGIMLSSMLEMLVPKYMLKLALSQSNIDHTLKYFSLLIFELFTERKSTA